MFLFVKIVERFGFKLKKNIKTMILKQKLKVNMNCIVV